MAERREIDLGTPGGGARREHERRRAKREAAVRERHPRTAGLRLKLQAPPASEAAWATGAKGEEELAGHLARRCPSAIVLHDRRMPGSRANIDHLAVAPSGVYVIDTKCLRGKIEVRKPFFGDAQLVVAGRKRPELVAGLARQRDAVATALGPAASHLPIYACFCFINPAGQAGGGGVPLLRTLRINGFELLVPRKLSKRLNAKGSLGTDEMHEIATLLADAFPN